MIAFSRLSLALSLALAAALAPPASAAWFPGEPIDGPSADVVSVGDVDLARDGTGGVVYLRREGGVPHVFVSRMVDGAWRPPERVDAGLDAPATAATLTAGDGKRLVVAFVSGGRLYGTAAPAGPEAGPFTPPQLLSEGTVSSPSADLGINGTAYVVYSVGGDVRATRLETTAWEPVGTAPLDVDAARTAGEGSGRPRVGVSAEGNAVATWGEAGRIFARRLTGLTPSVAPQEVSLPDFGGAPGGQADSPDLEIEDDGSYAWVSFRQEFGGQPRAIARRLVGSLFEAPVALDSGGPAGSAPSFSMNGRGIGVSVLAAPDNGVVGADLTKFDTYQTFYRLDGGSEAAPAPAVAIAERRQVGAAWLRTAGGAASVVAKWRPDEKPYDPEAILSNPAFGTATSAGPEIAADKSGDMAVAFVQSAGDDQRRLMLAVFDKPPAAPVGRSTDKFQNRAQPRLKWGVGGDLWGAQTFKVYIDDAEVATTTANEVGAPAPLADGAHRWRVTAIDRRGQVTPSRDRLLRIDTAPPRVRVKVRGTRRARATLRISVTPSDPRGSGVKSVSVDYGDRSAKALTRRSSHRYRRGGRYKLVVRVADRARNVTRKTIRLRIKR